MGGRGGDKSVHFFLPTPGGWEGVDGGGAGSSLSAAPSRGGVWDGALTPARP